MNTVLENIHFLRPDWLWLAMLAIPLVWLLRKTLNNGGGWQQLIDPELLKALTVADRSRTQTIGPWLAGAAWILAVIGLAGPAWERLPEPVHRKQDALIIALSLSDSMLATDLEPSRLDRARFALHDILVDRREGLSALIVYSGDAHVVTPLTDDARTIDANLPVLEPGIMPTPGNNIVAAVDAAIGLLRGAGFATGRLLLVTDSFPENAHDEVAERLPKAGMQLSVLAVGTPDGAPIASPTGGFIRNSDGSILVPATDIDEMRAGTTMAGGRFAELRPGTDSSAALLPDDPFAEIESDDTEVRLFDRWLDRGPWFVALLLPLAALGFRRGWLLIAVLMILPVPDAAAFEWADLWKTPDQQGAEALANGDAKRAASLFESPQWKGAAEFDAGDYDAAADTFAIGTTAVDAYNQGNALARAGKLEEALSAYDAALAQEPDFEDARVNRQLVEDLLKQQQQQEQQNQQGQDNNQDSSEGDENQDNQRDPKDSSDENNNGDPDDSEQESQEQSDQSNQDSDSSGQGSENEGQQTPQDNAGADETPEIPDEEQDQSSSEQPEEQPLEPTAAQAAAAEAGEPNAEQKQAIEQWLRQVPDNPGELLRRKFEYEYLLKQQQEGN